MVNGGFNRIAGSVATFSLVSTLWFAPPASACYADYEQMGVVEFRLIRNYVDSSPITDQLNFALGTTEFSSGSRTDAGFGMGFRTYFPIESRNQSKESEGKGFFNCPSIGVNVSFDYVPQITTDDFFGSGHRSRSPENEGLLRQPTT